MESSKLGFRDGALRFSVLFPNELNGLVIAVRYFWEEQMQSVGEIVALPPSPSFRISIVSAEIRHPVIQLDGLTGPSITMTQPPKMETSVNNSRSARRDVAADSRLSAATPVRLGESMHFLENTPL